MLKCAPRRVVDISKTLNIDSRVDFSRRYHEGEKGYRREEEEEEGTVCAF